MTILLPTLTKLPILMVMLIPLNVNTMLAPLLKSIPLPLPLPMSILLPVPPPRSVPLPMSMSIQMLLLMPKNRAWTRNVCKTWGWSPQLSHFSEVFNNYSPTPRWIIVLAYTSYNCFHIFIFQIFKIILPNSLIIGEQDILSSSWVQWSLKSKRNTYLWIFYCQISFLFWYNMARRLRLFKKKSSCFVT